MFLAVWIMLLLMVILLFSNRKRIGDFLFHTLQYQVTFASSWGESYIIRLRSLRKGALNSRTIFLCAGVLATWSPCLVTTASVAAVGIRTGPTARSALTHLQPGVVTKSYSTFPLIKCKVILFNQAFLDGLQLYLYQYYTQLDIGDTMSFPEIPWIWPYFSKYPRISSNLSLV